jgi:hypothetical protein
MMPSVKEQLVTFGAAAFLALWIWFSSDEDAVSGGGLPLLSKLGFGVAAVVLGGRFIMSALQFDDRTITHWLLRSVGFGMGFFLLQAIKDDDPFPSPAVISLLSGAVVFGLMLGWLIPPRKVLGGTLTPVPGTDQAVRIAALVIPTFLLSLAPVLERKENVLLTLILAMVVATPGAERWSDIRWCHWMSMAIGVAALLTGLFAAR